MKVLVIGSHGQIGKKITAKLHKENHEVLAMVRNEAQVEEMEKLGGKAIIADLEGDLSPAFNEKPDAVIFTAGSGAHTGKDKTMSVDLQGALKSIDESVKHGASRFVMISALGANNAEQAPDSMRPYFVAKSEADQYLVQSELDYTILRPGRLTDNAGKGSVNASESIEDYGNREISRDDVATAAVALLGMRNTHKKVIELLEGNTPVHDALQAI